MRSLYKLLILSSILFITTCEDKKDKFGSIEVSITTIQGSRQNNRTTEIFSNNITKVTISISGVEPVNVDLSSGQTLSETINDVPVGEQTVRIDLKNSNGTIFYTQTKTVNVEAGQTSSPSFPADDFDAENVVLEVTSPNGGEEWELGSTQEITWTTSHSSEDVSIALYKEGNIYQVLTDSINSTGTYNWVIETDYQESNDYTMRISSFADLNVFDESDEDFTLSAVSQPTTITVTSPNGEEDWELGSTQEITWSSVNVSGNVKIELYKSGSVEETLSSDESNDGSYSWTISSELDAGTDYRIRISSLVDLNVFDESDGDFNIINETVTDIDGNVYQTVEIGGQIWMKENLRVTHYRNGDEISTGHTTNEWTNLTTGAYCAHSDNDNNGDIYGYLYNGYAGSDSRNIAPEGWHVPTDEEFKELEMYLGMSETQANSWDERGTDEGNKLKEAGFEHWVESWNSDNHGTNESGFTALPGGSRSGSSGSFSGTIGDYAKFWTRSNYSYSSDKIYRGVVSFSSKVRRNGSSPKSGYSIRCVKD